MASAYRLDDIKLVEADGSATPTPVDFSRGVSLDGDDSGGGGGDGNTYKYKKVTTITSGKAYLIVASDQYAAKPITNTNGYGYLNVDNVTVSNGEITTNSNANEWVFTEVPGNTNITYTIAQSDNKLLYQTGTYNSFNVAAQPTSGQYWSVTFNADGQATITNTSVNKYIQYSASYTSYGSYADAQTNGVLPTLFERVDEGGSGGGGGGNDGGDGDGTTIKWTIGSAAQSWAEASNETYGNGFAASDNSIKVAYYKHASTSTPVTPSTDHFRVYKNSVLVITPVNSAKKIKSVTIEATGANYCSNMVVLSDNNANATASGTTITWSKAAGVASFEAQASNGQVRIKTITVVLSD